MIYKFKLESIDLTSKVALTKFLSDKNITIPEPRSNDSRTENITVKELPTWSIKNDQGGGMPWPLFLTPVGASMFPLRGDIWDKEFTTFSI